MCQVEVKHEISRIYQVPIKVVKIHEICKYCLFINCASLQNMHYIYAFIGFICMFNLQIIFKIVCERKILI